VHRLVRDRQLVLGGVKIPADFGCEGHSDADVLSHALTDAILGSVALGDIGMHFPDNDPRWKGANSLQFLTYARDLMRKQGFELVNVDTTVILEKIKLKDYRFDIRERLASTLDIPIERISVKFKTAERLGPVGEGRAAEAQAIVMVRRIQADAESKHTYHV